MTMHPRRRHIHERSAGDAIADAVTSFVGSWRFVLVQSAIMAVWVAYNVWVVARYVTLRAFDPFPFVFLNLFMSAEAAYSTPFILMSQNRQAARDRKRDDTEAREVEELHGMNERQLEILAGQEGIDKRLARIEATLGEGKR